MPLQVGMSATYISFGLGKRRTSRKMKDSLLMLRGGFVACLGSPYPASSECPSGRRRTPVRPQAVFYFRGVETDDQHYPISTWGILGLLEEFR
jgi:hypothetical protein